MKKKLHILGAGAWQVPSIMLAKSLGYEVLVCDMFQDRPGYALADFHEVVDISDAEAILAVAKRHEIDGILCDTTDVGVTTAAYVAERLALPGIGYEVARRFCNKYLMRQAVAVAGLQPTRFKLIHSVEQAHSFAEDIGYPLVIKPVDNQSSRGVHVVRNARTVSAAWEDANQFSRRGGVMVEEFLPGVEVTVEGFCLDYRYYTLAISDKQHFAHRPEVASRLTYPPAMSDKVVDRIRTFNAAVVQALGLKTGVTHAEYMVDGDQVRLVEIAARGGGTRIFSHIAPFVSGIDVPSLYMRFCMGEPIQAPSMAESRAANLEFFNFPGGKVKAVHGLDTALAFPGVCEVMLEFKVGDVLQPPTDDRSRPGFMLVTGASRAEVLSISERVRNTVVVEFA
jgi:biotin carboxylase